MLDRFLFSGALCLGAFATYMLAKVIIGCWSIVGTDEALMRDLLRAERAACYHAAELPQRCGEGVANVPVR